jgi:hypothetical protein
VQSPRWDLNPWPHPYQGCALPAELRGHDACHSITPAQVSYCTAFRCPVNQEAGRPPQSQVHLTKTESLTLLFGSPAECIIAATRSRTNAPCCGITGLSGPIFTSRRLPGQMCVAGVEERLPRPVSPQDRHTGRRQSRTYRFSAKKEVDGNEWRPSP